MAHTLAACWQNDRWQGQTLAEQIIHVVLPASCVGSDACIFSSLQNKHIGADHRLWVGSDCGLVSPIVCFKNVLNFVQDWPINQHRTQIKYIFTLPTKTAPAILVNASKTSILGHATFSIEDGLQAL